MKNELLLISIASDSHRNIGCLSLFATALEAGISTNVLFIPRMEEHSQSLFSAYLRGNGFRVVGVSLTTRDYHAAVDITAQIRRALPDAHVVWGGIHATSKPEECLAHADSICMGEAEESLLQLLAAIKQGGDLSSIPGVGVRGRDGRCTINPPRTLPDLDALPFPRFDFGRFYVLDRDGLNPFGPGHYARYSRNKKGDGYVLLTSRSCPRRCSYCINSFLRRFYGRNAGPGLRRRSVDKVIEEILYARASMPGIGFVNFMDDLFLTSDEWIEEFCPKYKAKVDLPFIIRATPESIDDGLMSLLGSVGLHSVQMGIESGSSRTHKEVFHRAFSRDRVLKSAAILNRHGFECLYDFIIENDFETDEDRDRTIELMLDLPRPYVASLFVMTVFPGTDLEQMYRERGMTPRIDPYKSNYFEFNEDDFYYQLATLIPSMSDEEARRVFSNRKDPRARLELARRYRATAQGRSGPGKAE